MDIRQAQALAKELRHYLELFHGCFSRSEGRQHLAYYLHGQLSDLPRKTVEAMALANQVPVRTLQDFLATHTWDHEQALDRLQQLVAEQHYDEQAIGLIDETSFPKRGEHTVGVQRQHCGATGKIDHCMVSAGLGYANLSGAFRCVLEHRLYLPQSWADDARRCRRAGLEADQIVYRPKWQIALAMLERAKANGLRFAWLTFDEGYGRNVQFLETLDRQGQNYVAEVPATFHGWLVEPQLLLKEHHAIPTGRPRRFPRLAAQSAKAHRVDQLCRHSPVMTQQTWIPYHIKDSHKGPVVWQIKAARFRFNLNFDEDGQSRGYRRYLPSAPRWLIVARNPLTEEVKYFVSNAPAGVPLECRLHVAFSRWHIERCFQDEKSQLGLDHFECRRFRAVHRHLILSCISHLFLARMQTRQKPSSPENGEKNPPPIYAAPGAPDRGRGGVLEITLATETT